MNELCYKIYTHVDRFLSSYIICEFSAFINGAHDIHKEKFETLNSVFQNMVITSSKMYSFFFSFGYSCLEFYSIALHCDLQ